MTEDALHKDALRIAVLGPGAVGGFLLAVFVAKGACVEGIGHHTQARALSKSGITLQSRTLGAFTVHPNMTTRLTKSPDILFIATKATDLPEALERVSARLTVQSVIIPLQNGIEHLALLRERFGRQVAAASISIDVRQKGEGIILHLSSEAEIALASDGDIEAERLHAIAAFLSSCGIKATVGGSEAAVMWNKLVRLNALALATAATGKTIGELRTDIVWRARIKALLAETAAVAHAEGVRVDPNQELRRIDAMAPEQSSSLARDVARKEPSELDHIAGAVLRIGKTKGIACPTVEEVIHLIMKRYE